jgi:hypothetical protein
VKTTAIDISPLHLDARYSEALARSNTLSQRRETLERSGRAPIRVPLESLAAELLANPNAALAYRVPDSGLPLDAEIAALKLAEEQAQRDVRAARDTASSAACAKLAPTRRGLIHQAIAALTAGVEAIEAETKIRHDLTSAGYDDDRAAWASHIDLETLRRLLERAREVSE